MKKSFVIVNRFSHRFFKNSIRVGLGEIAIGEADINLRIPALGSCIGLVLYVQGLPRDSRIACMAHIMYSSSDHPVNPQADEIGLGKYADKAISMMISILEQRGYQKIDFLAKMTGDINNTGTEDEAETLTWKTNTSAVIEQLKYENIPLKASYVGGSKTLETIFNIRNYQLLVTPMGEPTIVL
ncbi:MAG: chemotaxis protein CheD [Candidatus Hodarchaeales archaeon]|jgi:chemotaxis receptor (MCP) glutamine deamidase CheD